MSKIGGGERVRVKEGENKPYAVLVQIILVFSLLFFFFLSFFFFFFFKLEDPVRERRVNEAEILLREKQLDLK